MSNVKSRFVYRCSIVPFTICHRITSRSARGSISSRRISHGLSTMTASKIDGSAIAKKIKIQISRDIQERQSINPAFKPSLVIIQGLQANDSRFPQLIAFP